MSFYALTALINGLTSLILGGFIFWRNRKVFVNKIFIALCWSVALWGLAYFFWQISESATSALFWSRTLMAGAIFIPVFYLHFVLSFLGAGRTNKRLLIIVYVFATISFISDFTDLFVRDVTPKLSFQFWPNPGMVFHIFLAVWFLVIIYSSYLLLKKYRKSTGVIRSQIKYILLGTSISYIGGATNFLLWYDIPLKPYGNIVASLYVGTIAYAMLKHRLMDIRVVVKRSTLFSGLVAVVGLAYVLAAWAVGFLVTGGPSTLRAQVITGLIVAALTAVGFQPLYHWLQRTTDKFLFKNDYRPEELIGLISGQLATVLELKTIKEVLARELEGAMKVEGVEVTVLDNNKAQPAYARLRKASSVAKAMADTSAEQAGDSSSRWAGLGMTNSFLSGKNIVGKNKNLADYFLNKKSVLVLDEMKRRAQEGVNNEKEARLIVVMENSGLAVAAPLFAKEELIGVLGLGRKKSGDMFTTEDLRTLETIASQAAIAIENARLYEETKGFSLKLQGEVDRQTVELTKANEDLKKLDKAKSDFISIASHQLRTPLSVIKGGISMILEGGAFGSVAGVTKEKLSDMYEYNERLIKLVDDLLDLSHMEGGKMKYEFKKVDLAEMTGSVVKELSQQAEKKKLKLAFVALDSAIWVRADEGKLRQVVMNLIDNAIKYTDKGGVEVSLAKKDGEIQFAVRDTGMGMTKEELGNLFQKFVRGANAPRYHTDGSGIGLYVAKKMIEEHGGSVWAESEGEGKGSTFFVKMGEWAGS